MSKIVEFTPIEKLQRGLNIVADAVKVTIGPKGKNVIIEQGLKPLITNDGGVIAREIVLKDPIENMGASIIKEVVQRTSEDVGGGRTASAILTQALFNEGISLISKGSNVNRLKDGMKQAVLDINAQLDTLAVPVEDKLEQVATISTESAELGKVIADTVGKIGKDGVVTVEESNTFGITSEIAEGLKFDKGYISPYMATNERMEAEYEDVSVLVTERKVSLFKDIKPTIDNLMAQGRNKLIVIAEDIDGEALNVLVLSKLKGIFNTLAIKAPSFGDNKKACLEDLAQLTGATVWTEHNDVVLGTAKKIISTKDSTVIIGGGGDLQTWLTTLKTRKELSENKWEKDQYVERIAKLSNGIAVIKVGASSETELKYLKLKIEDGVNETKRALEEGVVVGGDIAFLNARKHIKVPDASDKDFNQGYMLVLNAIGAPAKQIITNANGDIAVLADITNDESVTIGYNALTNSIVTDMFKEGIIDAVKVPKTALQNAVGAVSMALSTVVAIAEEVKVD